MMINCLIVTRHNYKHSAQKKKKLFFIKKQFILTHTYCTIIREVMIYRFFNVILVHAFYIHTYVDIWTYINMYVCIHISTIWVSLVGWDSCTKRWIYLSNLLHRKYVTAHIKQFATANVCRHVLILCPYTYVTHIT